jgi:hypothetical protein
MKTVLSCMALVLIVGASLCVSADKPLPPPPEKSISYAQVVQPVQPYRAVGDVDSWVTWLEFHNDGGAKLALALDATDEPFFKAVVNKWRQDMGSYIPQTTAQSPVYPPSQATEAKTTVLTMHEGDTIIVVRK